MSDTTTDHRSRTGALRRERTRRKLLESALAVFADKGIETSVIDDVIGAAGVSRGTFYNYFPSIRAAMIAANHELGKEVFALIEAKVSPIPDPAERVAQGLLIFQETALAFPLFAHFVRAVGLEAAGQTSLLTDYLPTHLEDGMAQGRFAALPMQAALDLIAGSTLVCLSRALASGADSTHRQHVIAATLRGLGLEADEALKLAGAPASPLEPPVDSLLVKSHQRRGSEM